MASDSSIITVTVLSLVKNNETWLAYVFSRLQQLEQRCTHVKFSYAFFENDSKDKTRDLIRDFLKGKDPEKNKLITASLPPYLNRSVNYDRVKRLGDLRNALLHEMRPFTSDYTLMIDSEIYFEVEAFVRMLEVIQRRTDLAMITPYASQIFTATQLAQQGMIKEGDAKRFQESNKIFTVNHYYDTFAFVDTQGRNYWPKCVFPQCKQCDPEEHKKAAVDSDGLCIVNSAFGGFALIRSSILNDPRVKWDTVDLFDKYALCEHILFCNSVRIVSGKKIAVDTQANKVHWIG